MAVFCVVVPILTVDEPTKKVLVPALTDVPLTILNPLEVPRIISTSAALADPYPKPNNIKKGNNPLIKYFFIDIPPLTFIRVIFSFIYKIGYFPNIVRLGFCAFYSIALKLSFPHVFSGNLG